MKFSPSVGQDMTQVAVQNIVDLRRAIYKQSFYRFFKDAWAWMDPASYVDGWHIRAICVEMEMLARRETRDLVVNIPPRHAKSLLISVAFPAWVWTWNPAAQFFCASYDIRLATRDSIKTRRLIESPWYQLHFGETTKLRKDQNQKTYYETTAGGYRLISSPDAGATGWGGDFLLADDPHNVMQAESDAKREATLRWWFEAMSSRGNQAATVCRMIVQQRVHEADLAGEAIRRGYRNLVFPAEFVPDHPFRSPRDLRTTAGELLWPERFDRDAIERLKNDLGTYAASGQLQQLPTPREGGMFQRHDFKIVEAHPPLVRRVRSWDLAATEEKIVKSDPDWTVGVEMGIDEKKQVYILDVIRMRKSAHQVDDAIKSTAVADGRDVTVRIPQDPGQAGKAQAEEHVRMLSGWPVSVERESGDKMVRARPFASQCEAGNVFMMRAAWNDEFIRELCGFPNFPHDDQVDAASGAFRELSGGNNSAMLDWIRAEYGAKVETDRQARLTEDATRLGWSPMLGCTAEEFMANRT